MVAGRLSGFASINSVLIVCLVLLLPTTAQGEGGTSTAKAAQFLHESLDNKFISQLPGVGPAYKKKFDEAGIHIVRQFIQSKITLQVFRVISKYLWENKDQARLVEWLKDAVLIKKTTDCDKLYALVAECTAQHL